MHIDTNLRYSHKRPNINCMLCALRIHRCLRMFDCYHSNENLGCKRNDMIPSSLYNAVSTGLALQHIHRCQRNFYHRGHSFGIHLYIHNGMSHECWRIQSCSNKPKTKWQPNYYLSERKIIQNRNHSPVPCKIHIRSHLHIDDSRSM